MFGWFKKKKTSSDPKKIAILFEYQKDEGITAHCRWPKSTTEEEKVNYSQDMGAMLCLLGEGELLPYAQQAVSINGERVNDSEMATSILIRTRIIQASRKGGLPKSNSPVVPSTRTFPVRADVDNQ